MARLEVSESWSLKRGHTAGAVLRETSTWLGGHPALLPPHTLQPLAGIFDQPNTARSQRAAVHLVPRGAGETREPSEEEPRSDGNNQHTEYVGPRSESCLGP